MEKNLNHDIKIYNASTDGKSVNGYINDFNFWFPKIPNFNPKYVIFYIGIMIDLIILIVLILWTIKSVNKD